MVMNLSLLCQEWFADCIAKTFDRNLSSVGNDAGFLKKQKEATWLQNDESLIIQTKSFSPPTICNKRRFCVNLCKTAINMRCGMHKLQNCVCASKTKPMGLSTTAVINIPFRFN